MNNDTSDSRARWQRWPRWAALLAVTVGIALLASGCGGGGGAAAGSSPSPASTYAKLVAWTQCMRTHGVPNMPEPDSNGVFNGSGINRQSAQFQSAEKACKSLQPDLGQSNPATQAKNAAQALKYTECMRAHGVPNFPDPNSNGDFNFSHNNPINQQSATYQTAQQDCRSIMSSPPQLGG